jgi:hypothetical protein
MAARVVDTSVSILISQEGMASSIKFQLSIY